MSQGLYSGVSGLALGTGLYRNVSGLWGGASGLIDGFDGGGSLTLDLNLLSGPLDPRITFSRTSQATLVDSTGKLTYAPNNLLTNSEAFEAAAWTKVNYTITSNAGVAPDGTTTADLAVLANGVAGNASSYVLQAVTSAARQWILSIYVKNSGVSGSFVIQDGSGNGSTINATTMAVSSNIGTGVGISEDVGNGWYRISVRGSSIANPNFFLYRSSGTGDGVAGLLLWGAQLEAVTYQTTPGTYNSTSPKNLLGYTQEFDNAAWTKSNSFIQTNLLTYSEDFTNAAWAKTDVTATANAIAAPNGTLTADLLTEGSAGSAFLANAVTTVASATYTYSIYVKRGNTDWLRLTCSDGTNNYIIWVNTATGAIGNNSTAGTGVYTSSSITAVGDGWYRVALTGSVPLTTTSCRVNSATANGSGTRVSGATYYLWGAQLVQGSTAGDYQRTDAAAAAVQYVAPDGSRTAEKLVENTAASSHRVDSALITLGSGATTTVSAYIKAGERTWAIISDAGVTNSSAYVNLATGQFGTINSGVTRSSIVDAGNGWYRVSISGVLAGTLSQIQVFAAPANNTFSYTGDGTSGIYIWGAQLSNSASLDPYVYNPVAAPTSAAYYGPRFDYDPVTLANKGLLIEEQRTNLLTYSDQFDNAAWVKARGSVTANTIASPDGTTNADTLAATSTGIYATAYRTSISYPGGAAYTLSVYAKAAAGQYLILYINEIGDVGRAIFDLNSGAISSISAGTTASAIPVGNGWWRCIVTATPTVTASGINIIGVVDSGTVTTVTSGKSLYIYGAQLEAGSFATSYIPTVASQVTRTYDAANILGSNFSNWYNQNEGTFAVEFDYSGGASSDNINARYVFDATNGGSVNIRHSIYNRSTTAQSGLTVDNGVLQANPAASGTLFANTVTKAAYAFKTNDFAFSYNGGAAITDNSGTVPTSINRMSIGSALLGDLAFLSGHIRRISYYPTRLPNATLQTLTAPPTTPSLSLDFTTQVFNVG